MRNLVLIHGRSQQLRDAAELKNEWMGALQAGLEGVSANLTIPNEKVRFPYYGQTLFELLGDSDTKATDVVVKGHGSEPDPVEQSFIAEAITDVKNTLGISEADIIAAADDPDQIQKDVQNWPWVLAALRVIDRIPGLSAATILLVTRDVYRYMRHPGTQMVIDDGVRNAFDVGKESVVVGHSLGSVVAYNIMKSEGVKHQWTVPTFITVGSPLGVTAIAQLLKPLGWPPCVGDWFNAYDDQDVVSLHSLDHKYFPVTPEIENYSKVKNVTPNKHGITGYLADPVVASRIRAALLEGAPG